jgi:uncharacterized DUF497 family protein
LWIDQILWDLDDDADGNVQHIGEHGLTIEDVEEVLYAATEVLASNSSGRPLVFGTTSSGKRIAVVFDVIDEDPLVVYPVTAYEPEE